MNDKPLVGESTILVRPGALGDTILTIPLVRSIRRLYPSSRLTWLGSRAYSELASQFTEFEPLDAPQWAWLFGPEGSNPARTEPRFDTALVALKRPDDVIRNLRTAGCDSLSHVVPAPPADTHLVEHLHRGLGLPIPPRDPALKPLAPDKTDNLLWVHPGSGGPRKVIPLEIMERCADFVCKETGCELAITAGEDDAFLKGHPAWGKMVNRRGAKVYESAPLLDLCKELGRARFFLGNDSGIAHLAAGLGVRSLVFFVATDPTQWAPWTPEEKLTIVNCRRALELEEALEACLRMTDARGRGSGVVGRPS